MPWAGSCTAPGPRPPAQGAPLGVNEYASLGGQERGPESLQVTVSALAVLMVVLPPSPPPPSVIPASLVKDPCPVPAQARSLISVVSGPNNAFGKGEERLAWGPAEWGLGRQNVKEGVGRLDRGAVSSTDTDGNSSLQMGEFSLPCAPFQVDAEMSSPCPLRT